MALQLTQRAGFSKSHFETTLGSIPPREVSFTLFKNLLVVSIETIATLEETLWRALVKPFEFQVLVVPAPGVIPVVDLPKGVEVDDGPAVL